MMKTISRICRCFVLLGGLMVCVSGPLARAQLTAPPFDGAVVRHFSTFAGVVPANAHVGSLRLSGPVGFPDTVVASQPGSWTYSVGAPLPYGDYTATYEAFNTNTHVVQVRQLVRFHAADLIAPQVTLQVQAVASVPGWFVLSGTVVEEGGSGLYEMDFQVSRDGLYLTPQGTWTNHPVFLLPNFLILNGTEWTDQLWLPVQGPQDEGQYTITVRATDGDGNTDSASATAVVGFPPGVANRTPGPLVLFEGDSLTLAASVSGTLPLRVDWLHDGAVVAWTNITSLPSPPFTNAWLRHQPLTTNHAGRYALRAINALGSAEVDLTRVAVIADLTPDLTAWLGWSVTGRVHVADPHRGVRLQWAHNGVTLTNQTNAFLAVTNLTSFDGGVYSLRATNGTSWVQRDIFQLDVLILSQLAPPPAAAVQNAEAFQFWVNGVNGAVLAVEATRDFRTWDILAVVTNQGRPLLFQDLGVSGTDQRYYRLRQLPDPPK
jgi:hypothetical protein